MNACSIKVRGVVQGVGFRPFVFRLARANTLAGWVFNGEEGVEIFIEGSDVNLESFVRELKASPPAAAHIAQIEIFTSEPAGLTEFTILETRENSQPTVRISPDLSVCDECLKELFDPADKRYLYPYINCTNCGPRYSVTLRLPYDRHNTTMKPWVLDDFCRSQYESPENRRFHAQPVACRSCGPNYFLQKSAGITDRSEAAIRRTADFLASGGIVAIKGLGGYHLACDAKNAAAVELLRERKYRKEKPFALMVCDLATAREIVHLSADAEALLTSVARPIVLAPAKAHFSGVASGSTEFGVMLPYTPLHHLLFAFGAPEILVMTSANRSSEPIAYEDSDAVHRLCDIADAFLIGERSIARRVDDSVARIGVFGPVVLRRSRGYAPGAVAMIPSARPILALGADLKNTVTLVVNGQAFVSQHIGDLSEYQSLRAFQETIDDLVSMYEVKWSDLLVVHDAHPQYASTVYAEGLDCQTISIQHHRAHIASVLAERSEWEKRVLGVSFDGTGFGDDGTIWGGEFFIGSVASGFDRVAHLRRAVLPGGDAAAQYPLQAAAGFLAQIDDLPDLAAAPFLFGERYRDAQMLLRRGVRSFTTSSVGRLFDAAAALLGFTRPVSFEGQAAMWLEQLARTSHAPVDPYPFPFAGRELDFRPLLSHVARDRQQGRPPEEIARAFQHGLAAGLASAIQSLAAGHHTDTIVFSGGVFQNELLLEDIHRPLKSIGLAIWTNHEVPPNDGGISLGQAALAAFRS